MAYLNHLKQFLGLHSLVLPSWSDRAILAPKLKKEYMRWLAVRFLKK
jgi:hypothetical protein